MADEILRIRGGTPLKGTVDVARSKNATLLALAASLLTADRCVIEEAPDVLDVRRMRAILESLGARIEEAGDGSWSILCADPGGTVDYAAIRSLPAAFVLAGPIVGRLRRAAVPLPGGSPIGPRLVDLHLKGFRQLGCGVNTDHGVVTIDGNGATGGRLFLGGRIGSTVLGTASLVMAAVLTPGRTRIDAAAIEPEIIDLCELLITMGAQISGVGSHHLHIEGVERLSGFRYLPIRDRIEAGTFLLAGAITGGDVTVRGALSEHLGAILDKLGEGGYALNADDNEGIRIQPGGACRPVDVVTHPFPAFPTDLQPPYCALMSVTRGISMVTERIFHHRFLHLPELLRLGADISMEGSSAVINGVERLTGAPVQAPDLRAGAALLLAGLTAEGTTEIGGVQHLDRGYAGLVEKLTALGGSVERTTGDDGSTL